jgi:hypothetical protein
MQRRHSHCPPQSAPNHQSSSHTQETLAHSCCDCCTATGTAACQKMMSRGRRTRHASSAVSSTSLLVERRWTRTFFGRLAGTERSPTTNLGCRWFLYSQAVSTQVAGRLMLLSRLFHLKSNLIRASVRLVVVACIKRTGNLPCCQSCSCRSYADAS